MHILHNTLTYARNTRSSSTTIFSGCFVGVSRGRLRVKGTRGETAAWTTLAGTGEKLAAHQRGCTPFLLSGCDGAACWRRNLARWKRRRNSTLSTPASTCRRTNAAVSLSHIIMHSAACKRRLNDAGGSLHCSADSSPLMPVRQCLRTSRPKTCWEGRWRLAGAPPARRTATLLPRLPAASSPTQPHLPASACFFALQPLCLPSHGVGRKKGCCLLCLCAWRFYLSTSVAVSQ